VVIITAVVNTLLIRSNDLGKELAHQPIDYAPAGRDPRRILENPIFPIEEESSPIFFPFS
jgi:hypothetical protein